MTQARPSDPEADYYQAVEEYFVSRRGEPLFLSSAEWTLVWKWRRAGLPLRIVLRGIRDALDAHAVGWNRDRPVRSLAYCAREVEAARDRWQHALALGPEGGTGVEAALSGFARDLRAARGLGPGAREAAFEIADELASVAPGARLADLTARLGSLEAKLLAAIRGDLGSDGVREVEEDVERGLRPYRDRMPARVLAQLREESLARRLLERHGLPRLSLFHLDAGASR